MRIHLEASKIYHTYTKNWVNRDLVICFFGDFWSFLSSGAEFTLWVFLLIFLHEFTLLAIDIDNIGWLEPFLPLWEHFWNRVSVQLNCASDLTPRLNQNSLMLLFNGDRRIVHCCWMLFYSGLSWKKLSVWLSNIESISNVRAQMTIHSQSKISSWCDTTQLTF